MLTPDKFEQIMSEYEIQSIFSHFSNTIKPPFIAWATDTDNFTADNVVYSSTYDYTVELYTRTDTLAEERKLEDFFNQHQLSWSKEDQTWIDEDKVMLSEYTVYG